MKNKAGLAEGFSNCLVSSRRGFDSLIRHHNGDMAKLVDAPGLGPDAARRGGSSPSIPTKF